MDVTRYLVSHDPAARFNVQKYANAVDLSHAHAASWQQVKP